MDVEGGVVVDVDEGVVVVVGSGSMVVVVSGSVHPLRIKPLTNTMQRTIKINLFMFYLMPPFSILNNLFYALSQTIINLLLIIKVSVLEAEIRIYFSGVFI